MAERIVRDTPTIPGETAVDVLGREYLVLRERREGLAKVEDQHKKELMGALADEPTDEKGHVIHTFPAPVGKVSGIQRQRRVSLSMDEEAAMALIRSKGLEATCLETVTVLNEDALLAANYNGAVSDDELAALYSEKESFALVLIKE